MATFTSDLSGLVFPLDQRVEVRHLRAGLREELLRARPNFPDAGSISRTELQALKESSLERMLAISMKQAHIGADERDVLEYVLRDKIMSSELEEDDGIILSRGQRLADKVARFGGSWIFISFFGVFILVWMIVNTTYVMIDPVDPYPFILLNLMLSCLAAIQAPIIMMSQNRQEEKDRQRSRSDYKIGRAHV